MTKKQYEILRRFAIVMTRKQVSREYIVDFAKDKLFPKHAAEITPELVGVLMACDGIVEGALI